MRWELIYVYNLVGFMSVMVACMHLHDTTVQTTRHVVGDALGWTILSGRASAYTTWVSLQTFTVDDILAFNFTNGDHDVAEVSATAYDPCTTTNPISLATTGPASLTLTIDGTHYYICTFTSHCQLCQKLTINVSADASTTPPSATPTTSASPPTTIPTPQTLVPTTSASPPTTTPTTPDVPCLPTSSPSSSPSSPPTVVTSDRITPPPPPIGGAPSFSAMVSASFLIIGLTFLNY
ncbi:cucumber peeling cupredoxin-like [Lactuca sativa]|uniref:cucumber peeling cupredoxin-like n=1 Tax=Lactuca sativa TaxID=4236 RepID=UPI000CD86F3E|nr:cucumber peeling cupredoxin-like [Lactuca sativa]